MKTYLLKSKNSRFISSDAWQLEADDIQDVLFRNHTASSKFAAAQCNKTVHFIRNLSNQKFRSPKRKHNFGYMTFQKIFWNNPEKPVSEHTLKRGILLAK